MSNAHVVVRSPQRGLLAVLVLALVTAGAGDALAQPRGGGGKADKGAKGDKGRSGGDPGDAGDKKGGKPKVFDFTGIDISGRLRTPQLLYFLDRAAEELERASLERRSFIPEMVRSIDEEQL